MSDIETTTAASVLAVPPPPGAEPITETEVKDALAQGAEERRQAERPAAPKRRTVAMPKPAAESESEDLGDGDKAVAASPKTEARPELRKIRAVEDMAVKEVLENLGPDGSFKISVNRIEPEMFQDPATGKMVKTSGHLKTYQQKIDEEFVAQRHGGGRYRLSFFTKNGKGSFEILTHRTIDVGGDPRTDDVPRTQPPTKVEPPVQVTQSENPTVVRELLDMTKDMIKEGKREPARPLGPDPTMQMFVESLQRSLDAKDKEISALRQEFAQMRNQPAAPPDQYKDKLVDKLMDGDSARLQAVRMQYESEIRQTKESHRDEISRLHDRFDRDKQMAEMGNQRMLDIQKQAHELALASLKSSYETQKSVLDGEIKRLEKENDRLLDEVKDLRARKEKSVIEQVKDFDAIKKAFNVDDSGGEKPSIAEQIVEVLPQAVEGVTQIINRNKPQPQQQAQPQPQRPVIVQDNQGNRFVQRNGQLVPVRKKGTKVQLEEGKPEVEIPAIEEGKLQMAISYLERAFAGNQDPEIVAQSAKPMMPEEILGAIQTLGVDGFLSKVAKLPSSSPLSQQAGRNWVRKVGKALVGE